RIQYLYQDFGDGYRANPDFCWAQVSRYSLPTRPQRSYWDTTPGVAWSADLDEHWICPITSDDLHSSPRIHRREFTIVTSVLDAFCLWLPRGHMATASGLTLVRNKINDLAVE